MNGSESNTTWSASSTCDLPSRESDLFYKAYMIFYIFGILGNLGALVIILRSRGRNRKHCLMLGCLVGNDLGALISMLVKELIRLVCASMVETKWMCGFRVVRRVFIFYSSCLVVFMGIERYLALTKPFFYEVHVTIENLKRSLLGIWLLCLALVCGPFFSFGQWYDENSGCIKYKQGEQPLDVAYAYSISIGACLLIICIVWCNLAVMNDLLRRRRTLAKGAGRKSPVPPNGVTKHEVEFSKLMVLLSAIFVLCWFPQVISIIVAQSSSSKGKEYHSKTTFSRVVHLLITSHFVLDPYLYVLQRWPPFKSLLRSCCGCGRPSHRDRGSEDQEDSSAESEVLTTRPSGSIFEMNR